MYKLYKIYTNVNRIKYAVADVCFLDIQKPYILYFSHFRIFASTTTASSVLFRNFVKLQDQYFYIQKDSQMNLYYRFI